jgi:hypothetical protein
LVEDEVVEIREEYIEEPSQPKPSQPRHKQPARSRENNLQTKETFDDFWNRLGNNQLQQEQKTSEPRSSQLNGFFAHPKEEEKFNEALKKVSRFKAQRQQMK